MRKYLLISLILFISLAVSAQKVAEFSIIHTNDMHSSLNGFYQENSYSPNVINNDQTHGGFARLSGYVNSQKEESNLLLVDAGDFTMGSLFQAFEVETGFQLNLMEQIGYDVVCIGNHEFDFGPEKLAEMILNADKNGAIPSLILTNIEFDAEDSSDNQLEKLYDLGLIQRTVVKEINGVKIGFIGLMGADAVRSAPYSKPVKFLDPIKTTKKYAKILREQEGVDMVVVLSHSGVSKNKKGEWQGEDYILAKKTDVDIIISGHTHTYIDKPLYVGNTPIVQGKPFAELIGRIDVSYSNDISTKVNYVLLDDKILGNSDIQEKIIAQTELISNRILKQFNVLYEDIVVETDFELVISEDTMLHNSNLGPFVADALSYYVNKSHNSTDIAMIAAGVIRSNISVADNGFQSVPDLFRVVPLGSGNDIVPGYPLAQIYLTGIELKRVLEVLLWSSKSSTTNFCYFSGLDMEYDIEKGLMKKISKLSVNGVEIDMDDKKSEKLYSIVANNYMLSFIGELKSMTLGIVKVLPKDINGNLIVDMSTTILDMDNTTDGIQEGKEWLALLQFVQSFEDTNDNGIPDIPEKYRK